MGIPAILSIDAGTTGTRAAWVTDDGVVHDLDYRHLDVTSPRAGVVEQDANAILAQTIRACRATLDSSATEGASIKALAIATQRSTAVLWDTATGWALVPAMVWQDTRYADELADLGQSWNDRLFAAVGRPAGVRSPYLWAVHHLRETAAVTEAYSAGTLAFGTIETWLLWNLTAGRSYVATTTNAVSAGAYILADHTYEMDWLAAIGFPIDLLPELRQDVDELGHTARDVLGLSIPIRAALGDQHAGTVGLGCLRAGQAMCVHGTGSFVDLLTGTSLPANPGKYEGTLTLAGWRRNNQTVYAVETFTATTGSALDWLCNTLGWFESPQRISQLAAASRGSGGVAFIPALTGLRTPIVQPLARASLSGLTMSSTLPDIAYAVLEGIAHSVVTSIEANQDVAGIAVSEIAVGGGMSASDPLLQMQADLTGIPMRRMGASATASLRGAAFMAGAEGTLWDSLEDAVATLDPGDLFEPRIPADERAARRSAWKARIDAELELAARPAAH